MEFDLVLQHDGDILCFVVVFLPFLAPCLNLVIHWTTPLDFDPQEPLGAGAGGVTCAVEQIPHTYSNQPLD